MNQNIPKTVTPNELFVWLLKKSEKPILVDVREDHELAIAPFPSTVLHLPLSQSLDWMENLQNLFPKNRPIVVICHSGIRSLNFGIWLKQQGLDLQVFNLDGGIDAWSVEIDQSIPRY